jgi:Ni/Co efflux regulator RcnB
MEAFNAAIEGRMYERFPMKRLIISLAAISTVLSAAPLAASAAPWQSINQRQANLERRIDQGVRTGELNRREAFRVRREFQRIERLEVQYRRSGGRLTPYERAELDRRFDRLSQQVYAQKHDDQVRLY